MLPLFHSAACLEYCEPFFGSGAIGWAVMAGLPNGAKVTLNDKDYWLYCLWFAVQHEPDELIQKIANAQFCATLFSEYKSQDGSEKFDPVECGFRKLAMHQMSFSGLGAMAGGPIGGARQDNQQYDIYARWNAPNQIMHVRERHATMSRLRVTLHNKDFAEVIAEADSPRVMFYLDPPYYAKGAELYVHSFTNDDHVRLRNALNGLKGSFLLSYDDHPWIRELYRGFEVLEINKTNTINTVRKNREILIKNY